MNLTQIRYFKAAAELENLTLAASRLHVAQSAVSRQIRLLEEELGVVLLERVGRGVMVTPAGRTMLAGADKLIDEVERIRTEVADMAHVPSGTLRIGANPSLGQIMFPRLVRRCLDKFPRIRLHLVADLTAPVQQWVRRGELDVAIISFPERDPELDGTQLSDEAIFLISAADKDPGLGPECDIKDVARQKLILPGLPNRERLGYERLAAAASSSLDCVVEVDSLSVMKSLARQGVGHLLLPYVAIGEDPEGDWKVSRVRGLNVNRQIVRSNRRPTTHAMMSVMALVEEEVALMKDEHIIR